MIGQRYNLIRAVNNVTSSNYGCFSSSQPELDNSNKHLFNSSLSPLRENTKTIQGKEKHMLWRRECVPLRGTFSTTNTSIIIIITMIDRVCPRPPQEQLSLPSIGRQQ